MPDASEAPAISSEEAQRHVVAFLNTPGVLGEGPVETRSTHISRLFFTPSRAFKLKRALRLPFLDFSDPGLRQQAAEREVILNRRTAPEIYLGVRSVTREAGGNLTLDGAGEAVDWLVEMRRFDDSLLADRLAENGHFGLKETRALCDAVIGFHGLIEERSDKGGYRAMATSIQDLVTALAQAGAPALAVFAEELGPPLLQLCEKHRTLLEDRRSAGRVRQCHGDMHLGNICVIDGRPTPFDCIEFNDDIACVDVLYDLAFPVMDLVRFDCEEQAQLLMNRYLAATRDYAGLALMPLFLAARAFVRVMAEGLTGNAETAHAYARLADALRHPPRPRLIAVGGLSGTGKSSVAYRLGLALGPGPGAVVLRSDEIRKRMFDKAPEDKLDADAYRSPVSRAMYARMREDAATALDAGWPVVADATFMAPGDRAAIEAVASQAGVPFTGIWLDAPADVLRQRIGGRVDDASDADVAVLNRQLEADLGEIAWTGIDAAGDLDSVAASAAEAL